MTKVRYLLFTATLGSQLLANNRSKTFLPISHCFMGKLKTSYHKELSYIAVAQLVAEATKQDLKENLVRHFDIIEGCARSLVEGALTRFTVVDCIA